MIVDNLVVSGNMKILQELTMESLMANNINGVSSKELSYLSGTVSNIQTQLDDITSSFVDINTAAREFKSSLTSAINGVLGDGSSLNEESSLDDITAGISSIPQHAVTELTSDATATEAHILSGKTAYINGEKVTGTMSNYSGDDVLPKWESSNIVSVVSDSGMVSNIGYYGTISFHPKEPGYYDTNSTINQAVYGLHPDIIKAGELIGGSGSEEGVGAIRGTYTSDATATAAQILSGKTAYVNGAKVTGTMTNQGAKTATLSAGGSYTIPAGYHDGSGKISVQSLATMTSSADATAAQILSGKKAYVDGTLVTGTMYNLAGLWRWANSDNDGGFGVGTYTWSSGGTVELVYAYIIPAYVDYNTKIIIDTKDSLTSKVLSGKTLCGQTGTATSDATATAAQILSGQTAYVKGSKLTGSMTNRGAVTGSIGTSGGTYTIPAGYHNGSGKVTGPTLATLVGSNVTLASNASLLSGVTAYGKNGTKYTGSIASKAAATYTPTTSNQTIAAGQYLSGTQTIKGDANLVSSNIVSGKSIFGVSGSATNCKFWQKTCVITDGTWSGVTLKDGSYVQLATTSTDSCFRYTHNMNFTAANIKYASFMITELTYGVRIGTANHRYAQQFGMTEEVELSSDGTYANLYMHQDTYNWQSSSSGGDYIRMYLYPNYIDLWFCSIGNASFLGLASTIPRFTFTIVYV